MLGVATLGGTMQCTDMGMSAAAAPIFAALPQTQCTRCGYPDCQAYAEAIAAGDAQINQCPPGGAEGIERLSRVTGHPVTPLNPANGVESARTVAFINENWCIGCTLCIEVCPTDAIAGSNKVMHTVIEPHCTGCELCIPVCPVDCIELENVTGERTGWAAWSQVEADKALNRYKIHSLLGSKNIEFIPTQAEIKPKNAVIEAALAKARLLRG